MEFFSHGEKVFVLGLGISGRAAAAAALAAGAKVRAWDDDPACRRESASLPELEGLCVVRDEQAGAEALNDTTRLLWSPGIPHDGARAHPLAAVAEERELKPVSDLEVFLRAHSAAHSAARVAAVTGTDGKSTTTKLLEEFLCAGGLDAVSCGNFGTPALALEPGRGRGRGAVGAGGTSDASSAVGAGGAVGASGAGGEESNEAGGVEDDGAGGTEDDEAGRVYVVEMSSYQLPLTPSLAAEVAVLVSLAPDHLDYHDSLEDYIAAKRMVFDRARLAAVVGVDDELSLAEAKRLQETGSLPVVPVSGLLLPQLEGAGAGVGVRDGSLWDAHGLVAPFPSEGSFTRANNRLNAAAAWAAASLLGAPREVVGPVLANFSSLPHRYELLGTAGGISYVNDSKATTVHAAAAALTGGEERAIAIGERVFWIAGGRGKGQDFAPLFHPGVSASVAELHCLGEAGAELRALAEAEGRFPVSSHDNLAAAFKAAAGAAEDHARRTGGRAVVLLSPACASFDQFANFAARGEAFRALVSERLGEEHVGSKVRVGGVER